MQSLDPICIAQDVTVFLDDIGAASITPDDVDNGSSVGCVDDHSLSLDIDMFDCTDVGTPVAVMLTVEDLNMTTSATCVSMVTVLDTLDPTAMCENITLSCDEFTGDLSDIGGLTANDNCSMAMIDTMILVDGSNTCGIGIITRRFTITDATGNTATCDQVITINGEVDPFSLEDITFPPTPLLVEDCNISRS